MPIPEDSASSSDDAEVVIRELKAVIADILCSEGTEKAKWGRPIHEEIL